MFFILLVFLAAFSLELIGTISSVIGITQLLGVDYLIISLAVCFDFAKIVSVSALYKEWNELPKLLRPYMLVASVVLMLITSAGASGYLASSFQKNILPTKSIEIKVLALTDEKTKLELRKIQIDDQIAKLPQDAVKGRTKLIQNFKSETEHLNLRLNEIDVELPKLQIESIEKSSHAGPIMYLSQALNCSVERAMSYIIGLIIFVFDPLAIALILLGNYLVAKRNSKREFKILEPEVLKIQEELEPEVFFEKEPIIEEIPIATTVNDKTEEMVVFLDEDTTTLEDIERQDDEIEAEEVNEYLLNNPERRADDEGSIEGTYRSLLNNPMFDKSDILNDKSASKSFVNYYN